MSGPASPRRVRLGPLQAIEFPAPAGSPCVVCLHGYGADGADLAPLALELGLPSPARWLFPDAPLSLGGPFGAGRAWFPIDESRLRDMQLGKPVDLSSLRPAGFDGALEAVRGLVEASGEPWENLALGGFSQGSMLAVELAVSAPRAPRGLFILSGTLVDEATLTKLAPSRKGLAFFQSHGAQDGILPYEGARRLNAALRQAGLAGGLFRFDGGHALPPEALAALQAYLQARS